MSVWGGGLRFGVVSELVVVPDGVALLSAVRPSSSLSDKSAPLSIRSQAHPVLPFAATQSERVINASMRCQTRACEPATLQLALGDRAA